MADPNAGVCPIKLEFIVQRAGKDDSDVLLGKHKLEENGAPENNSSNPKKYRDGPEGGNSNKKNKNRGQNKARPKTFRDEKSTKPCSSILDISSADEKVTCQFPNCKFMHDPVEYLQSKPEDIGESCYNFIIRGRCPRGISCRFGSSHITAEGYNKVDPEKNKAWKETTKNTLQTDVQVKLQKKKYDLTLAEKLVKAMDMRKKDSQGKPVKEEPSQRKPVKEEPSQGKPVKEEPSQEKPVKEKPKTVSDDIDINQDKVSSDTLEANESSAKEISKSGVITDEDLIKLLPKEKKVIDWRNKLYLSPLTTVGNLPFRRICKSFGADITCGEMALCESLLKGTKQEWALVKRHESEDLFGAQICGNNVYQITKVSQLLQENAKLDFIDLNLGCPIDLIYKQGGGSGMMHRLSSLGASVRCASKILSMPFTIKMRTGVYQNKKIAHTIVSQVGEWGASLITLHGRSREARYTRSADWEYIEQCAQAAAPTPVFGNGDILSYEDYLQRREVAPTVQGVMIGRGALIKPWIFTEIKEQRLWDISSKERFEIIKKYTNFGLEHWGSDTQGVENTRRFLLEWLSFLYRYVPVGLLERPPQKINERPLTYFGRDDLETMMASSNCADWVKISEMLLGPVPEGFVFLPKHKANAY